MKTITTLPNLSDAAKVFFIGEKLRGINNDSIINLAIQTGLDNGKTKEVIQMIRTMANDNRTAIEMLLGHSLLTDIENVSI